MTIHRVNILFLIIINFNHISFPLLIAEIPTNSLPATNVLISYVPS
jgi:hypothetical protein